MFLGFMAVLPILILLLTSAIIVLLRIIKPEFTYSWLLAAAGVVIAYVVMLVMRTILPVSIQLTVWSFQDVLTSSPELLFDDISWIFGLVLTGLAVAIIFTDVARAAEADWEAWASSLTIFALGLLAVAAGNLLTLVMAWAIIDFMELLVLLRHIRQGNTRERVIISFSARAGGIILLLVAWIFMQSEGKPGLFININQSVSIYLLLACGLRLGVLPLHIPFITEPPLRRGLGTALRIVPAATSYVLVTRIAYVQGSPNIENILLFLISLSALFGAYNWVRIEDELDGRPFWIIGTASLVMASSIRGEPYASISWGVTSLLAGGLLFLNSAPHRRLQFVVGLGLIFSLTFPFLPSWDSSLLYYPANKIMLLPLLIAHSLLVMGYIRYVLKRGHLLDDAERWVWIVYPLGLLILPITHLVTALLGITEITRISGNDFLTRFSANLLVIGFVWFLITIIRKGVSISIRYNIPLGGFFSFGWIYRTLWIVYRYFGKGIGYVSTVLEGEAGNLWAILMLILILALLIQV